MLLVEDLITTQQVDQNLDKQNLDKVFWLKHCLERNLKLL